MLLTAIEFFSWCFCQSRIRIHSVNTSGLYERLNIALAFATHNIQQSEVKEEEKKTHRLANDTTEKATHKSEKKEIS